MGDRGGAEILDDVFRKRHSPGKYTVDDYFDAQQTVIESGLRSTATMVIGFDETLQEPLIILRNCVIFRSHWSGLPSFLCWTYKPYNNKLGGDEVGLRDYLRWLAVVCI